MRGGISYIAKRHSKANRKYMKSYDDEKSSKFIMYLDGNNLYGCAISTALEPTTTKWLSVRLRTKWLWVQFLLQSLKLQISRLLRARSSLKFRQL